MASSARWEALLALAAAAGAAGTDAGFLAADLTARFGTAVAGAAVAPAAGAPSEELELSLLLSELDELSSFAAGFAGLTAATRVPVLFVSCSFFRISFSVDAVPSFFLFVRPLRVFAA